MRLSGFLFALFVGFALPALLIGAGVDLPTGRLAALLVFGTAIGGLIPAGLDLLTHHMRDEEESQRRQRDANTEMTLAHAAEVWAKLNAPAPVVISDYGHDWYNSIETFLMAGDSGGFSIRRMQGVAGSDVWAQLTTMLADAGWLANVPGRGYQWADGYTLARAITELRADKLPYPAGPAPVVNPPINNTTLRNTRNTAQRAIIDA